MVHIIIYDIEENFEETYVRVELDNTKLWLMIDEELF